MNFPPVPATLTDYQAKCIAHELQKSYPLGYPGKLAPHLFDALIEPKPFQIDAALFALSTPFVRGVMLADEVGLGKTIEAALVLSHYWHSGRRKILIIVPSSLRQQWRQELSEKFAIPATLLAVDNLEPLPDNSISICSYEFANAQSQKLQQDWDVVICDEAHKLRSYWTGKGKIARSVANICQKAGKVFMLTATPLQNRLEELYGMVSVVDPKFFYSLAAFRQRYVERAENQGETAASDDLTQRVAQFAKRTLRRDADRYVRFTQRIPLTLAFQPSAQEQELYEKINAYLQRPVLYAFNDSQRHLSALVLRKRLGSSTAAVASTLENIAQRMEAQLAAIQTGTESVPSGIPVEDLIADDVPAELSELNLSWERDNSEAGEVTSSIESAENKGSGGESGGAANGLAVGNSGDAVGNNDGNNGGNATLESASEPSLTEFEAEIQELRNYANLAREITENQKAVKLIEALEIGFKRLRDIGAAEKAIIFTDSTVTQEYLAQTLQVAGWGEGVVLFNGSNDSPQADEIYERWLAVNKDSDLITGIPSADRRKALVDEFRNTGKIMIATEAAAEGINLQFCSMLVNYDLPWNPQRVEQRIGRVHRFGQKFNVIVVNFSNKGNRAEERILELLTEKFQLFTSVFGASDEILGQIEDGVDFERSVFEILQKCKTAAEIDAAFAQLQEQHQDSINPEVRMQRDQIFHRSQTEVAKHLENLDFAVKDVIAQFESQMQALTRYELAQCAEFSEDTGNFILRELPKDFPDFAVESSVGESAEILLGSYFFKSAKTENAHQYRYFGPLAQNVLTRAASRELSPAHLIFAENWAEVNSDVQEVLAELRGKSGQIEVELVEITAEVAGKSVLESQLIYAGTLLGAEGSCSLTQEQVRILLGITARVAGAAVESFRKETELLEQDLAAQVAGYKQRFTLRLGEHFSSRDQLLVASTEDLRSDFMLQREEFEKAYETAKAAAQMEQNPHVRDALVQQVAGWERRLNQLGEDQRLAEEKLRSDYGAEIQVSEAKETRRQLISITWEVPN
ncbi:MAG: SNF2-related protein [Arcanobacterium sp.]|nr:SNF2-related protein [Arcanobacterium sp.]